MQNLLTVPLNATTARGARTEIRDKWPNLHVSYTGYDEDGQDVLISSVREAGNKAGVATLRRNRSKKAVRFVARIPA